MKNGFQDIDTKKAFLDKHRPLPPETVASIREHQNLSWTYNSNAIEGNTLTLIETKVVLEGITIGGKSLKEHLEVVNHRDAIEFVESLVAKKEALNEWNIKSVHQLVLKGIDQENAGRYRNVNVRIGGTSFVPPGHLHVPEEMHKLMDWYEKETKNLHPIEKAAQLHNRFVTAHPFVDGNGRTARLLMNFELMQNGYPPTIILRDDRSAYYEVVEKGNYGQHDAFCRFVAKNVEIALDSYLSLVSVKDQEPEQPEPLNIRKGHRR